jgi:hypothetical protein
LRRTAAEIAALAVYEIYPNVELWGGGETDTGFLYDFYFPHPIHIHLIEEKMRLIVKEKRPIRTLEMVAVSARGLLISNGHAIRAEELEDGLVELIQIGPFHDLCPGPHLKNTAELAAFKISVEQLPDGGIRISGACHTSKEGLKQYLKRIAEYTAPHQLGEQMGLWVGSVWLPQGLRMRQYLIDYLKKEWFADALEISAPFDSDRLELHRTLGKPKVAEIWTPGAHETQIQVSFFNKPEREVISSLQSIGKTLTILGFNHSAVSMGRECDFVVEDGLDRSQSILKIKRIPRKGSSEVDFYITVVVEKLMYLLLEKNLMMVELENQ